MKKCAGFLIALMLLLVASMSHANGDLHRAGCSVDNAWIREAPPVARTLAGFMTIRNPADTGQLLLGAESGVFEKIEMHRTVMEDGLAKMVRQETVEVPANGRVEFAPGGLHLMLINPGQRLKAGDTVRVTLKFKGGKRIPAEFTVRPADTPKHHH